MPDTHHNRHYLVVGGASGIGRSFVSLALKAGARVAVLDNNQAALDTLTQEETGTFTYYADVCDRITVDSAVAAAANNLEGHIDGLIYCVGIDLQQSFSAMAEADFQRVIDINLLGAMRVSQAALPFLQQAKGDRCIINVSSGAGIQPLKERSAYCVSKAGLNMLSKCLAMELGEAGIRVVTVAPGAVETDLLASSYAHSETPQQARAEIANRYALKRIAHPQEIAATLLFLCGPDATYITGTTIAVDGGRTYH